MPEPSIRNDEQYEPVRRTGASKEQAARIVDSPGASRREGESPPYEERTNDDLVGQAGELGREGRFRMTTAELADAVRSC